MTMCAELNRNKVVSVETCVDEAVAAKVHYSSMA